MASRDREDGPPVVPPRGGEVRRSRIAQARGYHPRAHTAGDEPSRRQGERQAQRPSLRLVADEQRTAPRVTRERVNPRTGERTRVSTTTRTTRAPATRTAPARRTADRTPSRTAGRTAGRTARQIRYAGRGGEVTPRLAEPGRRLRTSLSIVLVLFLAIAVRLVQFQFTEAPAMAAQGLSYRIQPVDLPAPRGNIVDRDGAILAGSAEARYVFADPELVKDPSGVADTLSPILGVPRSVLLPKVTKHRFPNGTIARFEYLARGVAVDTGTRIGDLDLAGIGVRRDESRVVPGHDLAANLIGFTGRDMNGLVGLEASYDEVLRGVDGERRFEIGQADGPVDLDQEIPGGFHEETPARPGSALQLTIDRDLQYEVQRILGLQMTAAKATEAAAVVLDVRTGEVLAQASYPFYNAADPDSSTSASWGDNATGLVLEPGSVHKGIVFAACLQTGICKPTDTVMVGPSVTKGGTQYTDSHVINPPRPLTLPGILAWSSNVGTIGLADKLGAERLYEYQRAFGLGEVTGVGLPGESPGLVQPPANWSASSYGSIPIGHGVSVTPLQMAAVYAAIANGGVYVQPHLVKAIIAPDGKSTPGKAPTTRQVISAETATALRNMLEAVVTADGATGAPAAVANYRVSGKTGTGRLIRDGKPVAGEVASFIGMAPADAPRYVVAVFAHTPGGTGGAIASPAFSEMMSYTLRHFKVPPTGTKPPTFQIYG